MEEMIRVFRENAERVSGLGDVAVIHGSVVRTDVVASVWNAAANDLEDFSSYLERLSVRCRSCNTETEILVLSPFVDMFTYGIVCSRCV